MSIHIEEEKQRFALHTAGTSYLMQVTGRGHLTHVYWGKRIHPPQQDPWFTPTEVCSFSPNPDPDDRRISLDTLPREYPDYGRSDYSSPAVELATPEGDTILEPRYHSCRILEGKPPLAGLPAVYAEKEDADVRTLIITLKDPLLNLFIDLYYSVFESYDVITRHAVIRNEGARPLRLTKALSASVDFFADNRFELVHLHGAHLRERQVGRLPLGNCSHTVESRRGASSHEQNPFMALVRPGADQFQGDVYAMSLVYSGSFLGEVCVNSYGKTRLQMGLNPVDFSWLLEPGASFTTPEAVLVYSPEGFNGISGIFHRLYRERLCRGVWKERQRPVLINNWEATYFDFTEQRIMRLMDAAAEAGIELFVLDDGWFGERNSDTTSLGDWEVNRDKLPGGIRSLSNHARARGMLFGLWVEPEMVSPRSLLYNEHPDWCLHVEGRPRSEGRNQLVLDLSREEVVDHLFAVLSPLIRDGKVDYIKWDMNRNITEAGSTALTGARSKEVSHRCILGLYRLLDRLTAAFPELLFESCAGGGGRFDPGMLYYTPQIWTSDNTDGHDRAAIQWGSSFVYPQVTMGAHLSAVPNHQVRRTTPLHTRAFMAMSAAMGFELDLARLAPEELEAVRAHIVRYKQLRPTLQFGRLYRLEEPEQQGRTAWMILSSDGAEAVLFCFHGLNRPNTFRPKLRLRYLEPDALYQVEEGRQLHGDTLMHFGLELPPQRCDFDSSMVVLRRLS